jgi:hypothetical protein
MPAEKSKNGHLALIQSGYPFSVAAASGKPPEAYPVCVNNILNC